MGGETYKALALKHAILRKNTRAKFVEVRTSVSSCRLYSIKTNAAQKYGLYFDRISFCDKSTACRYNGSAF